MKHSVGVRLRSLLCAAALGATLGAAPVEAQEARWFATWSASPGWGQPEADTPTGGLDGDTVRTVLQTSLAGDAAQLRISNLYGDRPLKIGRATIGRAGSGGSVEGGVVEARFNGGKGILIQPGGSAISDPVAFDVPARQDLAVSLFLEDAEGPATAHDLGVQTSYVAAGDQTGASALNGAATTASRYFLTGVDVLSRKGRGTIVAFGDSITDGYMITLDSDKRWPDLLAKRLARAGMPFAVANAGISGNGHVVESLPQFGDNAQERFDRDVLSLPNVTHMIVLLGINDIGQPGGEGEPPTKAKLIIDSLAQLAARARSHGIKVFGATLTPFEGTVFPGYYTEEGEVVRQKVNAWIRSTDAFDGVVDFETALADPKNPTRIRPAYDYGDRLHPNDKGFAAMAEAIDLGLFR
ncbi:SGNH/GDSL hydrolase family protein [Chenggangzhangella methanolivorans]|uniref:SGNH/GDSL hydrolase family protein n=1 Tax=Chenggangzhangella methanolivorans TaxID=1437009 RepID=A0A9E6RAI7_9HYPH|nr:SGNH/GDSL hydrolase family protein [Chenggangzhangella methanolivorans]QZO01208.1 SGNH/GDSL hydrolase family protein [Chenggangzhangella methanolivorans]